MLCLEVRFQGGQPDFAQIVLEIIDCQLHRKTGSVGESLREANILRDDRSFSTTRRKALTVPLNQTCCQFFSLRSETVSHVREYALKRRCGTSILRATTRMRSVACNAALAEPLKAPFHEACFRLASAGSGNDSTVWSAKSAELNPAFATVLFKSSVCALVASTPGGSVALPAVDPPGCWQPHASSARIKPHPT